MVAGNTTASSRKRTKADDMVESPPKRVTRARAAKSTDEPATDGPVSRKITTASAKAGGVKKASTATKVTKSSTRKEEPKPKAPKKTEDRATKTTTRARATAKKSEEEESEPVTAEAPKTRTRRAAVPAKESTTTTKTTKPTTRTKRAAEKSEPADDDESKEEQPRRTTRGRPAGSTTRAAAASTKVAAPRKKVTFEDESSQDKENIPVTKSGAKKESGKATTGLRARPVRKAAPTRSALRSKQAKDDGGEQARPSTPPKPLSPKKINQVAKSGSGSSEDELGRTPVRALAKSPVKAPLSVQKSVLNPQERVDELHETQSSSKTVPGSVIKSPAKRQPVSPFKEALRESPKKFQLEAKKDNEPDIFTVPLFKDALKQSPKKASFLSSISPTRQLQPSQTPLKASLLASPARRPASPAKAALFVSPGKSTLALSALDRNFASAEVDRADVPPSTPGLAADSPAKKSISPIDLATGCLGTPLPTGSHTTDEVSQAGVKPGNDCTLAESPDGALTPPGLPVQNEVPTFVKQSPKFRSAQAFEDSDSEDELSALQASKKTPVRRKRRSTRHSIVTPANGASDALSTSGKVADLAITPLAVQLSTWLASSPEKREDAHEDEAGAEAQLLRANDPPTNRVSLASQESATTATTSPRFFAEQMAIHDLEAVQVHEDRVDTEMHDVMMIDAEGAGVEEPPQSTEHFGDENAAPHGTPSVLDPPVSGRDGSTPRTALGEAVFLDDIAHGEESSDDSVIVTPAAQEALPVQLRPEGLFATPVRRSPSKQREVHTVCKVPLRPEGSRSPIKILKKRSKSMANSSGIDAAQVLAQARNMVLTRQAAAVNDEAGEDPVECSIQQATPRPKFSLRPPATMPAKARKISARPSNDPSPIKVPKKRGKSLVNPSKELGQDPRTILQPSTSFESPEEEDVEDELASAATPRVVRSEIPPATMPLNSRKVPLRPEGEASPIKIAKKRGKSMGAPLGELSLPVEPTSELGKPLYPQLPGVNDIGGTEGSTPGAAMAGSPRETTSSDTLYGTITPAQPHRAGADAQILKGAVVFVDVHTTEGADASEVFVELLTLMGARCVKQWTWNPRASVGRAGASAPNSPDQAAAPGKVGITHVVFKDGGKRTLQKVREAKGLVLCVGVGWVLECVSPIFDSCMGLR